MGNLQEKRRKDRLPVVKMEIDYELMRLFEAIEKEDEEEMETIKERLEALRKEWIAFQ